MFNFFGLAKKDKKSVGTDENNPAPKKTKWRRWVIFFIVIGLLLKFFVRIEGVGALPIETVQPIIKSMLKDQMTVEKVFAGRAGLTGVVVSQKAEPELKTVVWLLPDKKTMLLGNMFNEKGEDITQKYLGENVDLDRMRKYISDHKKANAAITESALKNAPGFIMYDKGATEHVLYVFTDPNCIFCHRLFQNLQANEALLAQHKIAVKWIPVGMVIADNSDRKAAAILKGGVTEFLNNESNYNESAHSGGTIGITDEAYMSQVRLNNKLVTDLFPSLTTPAYAWMKNGKLETQTGSILPDEIRAFIEGKML